MQKNAEKYGISRMGIFGSVARGDHREESDVDVYIEGNIHGFFAHKWWYDEVNYPEIPWKNVMGIRDIIVHHYFDVDADEIFRICKDDIFCSLSGDN